MAEKEEYYGDGVCPGCGEEMDFDEGVYFCDPCNQAFIWYGCFYDCVDGYDCIDRLVVRSFI